MSKEKKPFSETKIGKFIKEKVQPVAGDVLEFVGDVTGIEAIDKVGEFLNRKKQESAEAMALHLEFEKLRTSFEIEMYSLQVKDVADARAREVSFMQANGGGRDWIQGSLVIFTMVLLAAMIAILAFYEIPANNRDVFNVVLGGAVVGGAAAIYNYYFGSSRGSANKEAIINKMSEQ